MRGKIAVVDDSSVVTVYDLKSGKVLFAEPHASSVAWNAELDDMLCFSGEGTLSIKTANFPLHQQRTSCALTNETMLRRARVHSVYGSDAECALSPPLEL